MCAAEMRPIATPTTELTDMEPAYSPGEATENCMSPVMGTGWLEPTGGEEAEDVDMTPEQTPEQDPAEEGIWV